MDLRVGKNYQLIKKIGSGAFGEIYEGKLDHYLFKISYLGKNLTTKESVAIKLVILTLFAKLFTSLGTNKDSVPLA